LIISPDGVLNVAVRLEFAGSAVNMTSSGTSFCSTLLLS
jgi:hypothetical protein